VSGHRIRVSLQGAMGAALFALATSAAACGLEDPGSISMRRGMLNMAYPESLHVGTAVWQAQLAGRLPRDPVLQFGELSADARSNLRLARAKLLLGRFAARLGTDAGASAPPSVAVVLLGPVLWSRLELDGARIVPALHVDGPEGGDVVLVTDLAAIEAVAAGSLGVREALDLGVMRLYGPPADVAAARDWLATRTRG
jgi:hypothetical protein